MIPVTLTVGPLAAAVANFYVTSVTPVSGTALTLAHTAPATPRRILLTFGNEGSPRTLVVTGTNADGNPIQETLAVPSGGASTVASIQDFATLTSAVPLGGGWTAATTLGTNGVASSPWKLTNALMRGPVQISWGCVVSGTINYGIEYTYDNPNGSANTMGGSAGNYPTPPQPWSHPTMANLTTSADGSTDNPILAWRVIVNSGTGSVTVTAIEAGMQ